MTIHTEACFSAHLGPYMMRPDILHTMVSAWEAGLLPIKTGPAGIKFDRVGMVRMEFGGDDEPRKGYSPFLLKYKGARVALFPVIGEMSKRPSKHADVSTLEMRSALRRVNAENLADVIALHVESNGGMAEGMAELSDEIKASRIPVHAYVEDRGFSAGYFAAASAQSIGVNPNGWVGSIGTIAVLVDNSAQMEKRGVRVIAVTTAPQKALGMDGKPVTEEDVAIVADMVRKVNEPFARTVKEARGFTDEQYSKVSTGAIFRADEAKELGLVDHVETFDGFLERITGDGRMLARERAKARVAVASATA